MPEMHGMRQRTKLEHNTMRIGPTEYEDTIYCWKCKETLSYARQVPIVKTTRFMKQWVIVPCPKCSRSIIIKQVKKKLSHEL